MQIYELHKNHKSLLPHPSIWTLGHIKRLQRIPRPLPFHGIVCQVRDGVDGLVAHDGDGLVREGV
jgi:hypothetical protein